MKKVLSVLMLCLTFAAFAQSDSVQKTKLVYTSLRVRMILKDTIAYPFKEQAANKYALYQFEIDSIYRGEHDSKNIWVIATKEEIEQFYRPKMINNDYWWILCEKIVLPDGRKVFRKCGAW